MTTYATNDMYVACALVTAGQKLLDMTPSEDKPHEFVFVFDNSDGQIKDLIDEYYNGTLLVDALSLTHNVRDLKTRIMQARDFSQRHY
jgi:hypothetical protein